jgi:hypothetical protein
MDRSPPNYLLRENVEPGRILPVLQRHETVHLLLGFDELSYFLSISEVKIFSTRPAGQIEHKQLPDEGCQTG